MLIQIAIAKAVAYTALLSLWLSQESHAAVAHWKRDATAAKYPGLLDATTDELRHGLEEGHFTSVDLVKAYTARINEVNDTLHAVVELNPDALSIAQTLDEERRDGKCRGPLHGIPILLKNNIATNDRMQNTAGSYALLGAKVSRDSGVAAKLRGAGAVLLGKTNLSQWANFRSLNSSNGWSALGGQTYGAYYARQDPSGSSSGSGVGSGVGLALASLGTETAGSIVSPCDVGNLACIKPTVGLTSRALVVPISEHQDTVGPLARTVKDAAYLLGAIAGKDPADNYTSAIPFPRIPDYAKACDKRALRGKRIGIPRNVVSLFTEPAPDGPDVTPIATAFEAAIATVKALGATIVENTNFTAFEELANFTSGDLVLSADFLTDLPKSYLSQLSTNPTGVQSVADVRNFTRRTPVEDYPDRDTGVWDEALDKIGFGNDDPRFWPQYQHGLRLAGPLGLTGALQNFSLDAVILPTSIAALVPAVLGSPIVTVPLGFYPPNTTLVPTMRGDLNQVGPNLPFGLSFLGDRFTEEALIGFAYAFEQATMVRKKVQPVVVPRTELVDVINEVKKENKRHIVT